MTSNFNIIKNMLFKENPYLNISNNLRPFEMQVFSTDEMGRWITNLISTERPNLIIEVGSWMGWSAIKMADAIKKINLKDSGIICVDTWLGALEFWATGRENAGWWQQMHVSKNYFRENHYKFLSLKSGYPSVYYNFISNVFHKGHQNIIYPFPQTSDIASKWFLYNQIEADLIYIDASHDYEDVKRDLKNYFKILKEGGTIFGDDYWIHEVKKAVDEFVLENKLTMELGINIFWKIKKGNKDKTTNTNRKIKML